MLCYRDMTYCPFYKDCKSGDVCERALNNSVKKNADKWWGKPGAPICRYAERPECFKSKNQ